MMVELNPIADLLSAPIPKKLWHYTSVHGFHGIVNSKKIFATDLRFLNDREEFLHARRVAVEVAEESEAVGRNGFPLKQYLQDAIATGFNSGMLHPSNLQVFVTSFSAAEDQLSQWRGYSQETSGVSLGFDLAELRPPPELDTLVCFAPCVYEWGQKKALLRHAVHQYITEMEGQWDSGIEAALSQSELLSSENRREAIQKFLKSHQESTNFLDRLRLALATMTANLLRVAALSKNEAFREEKEWRLVLPVSASKKKLQNPPQYLSRKTSLVPYIPQPLPTRADGSLTLTDVIVGPGSHPNAAEGAHFFLTSQGLQVLPRESSVPFRPW